MERLNQRMSGELARFFAVRVIGPAGAGRHAPTGVTVREAPLRPVWRFLIVAGWRAIRLARVWQPDVVLAGSGLTAPLALLVARLLGARAAVYVHGLDLVVPHPIYRMLWRPVLRRMDRVVANSRATAALARGIGVVDRRISVVHPGVEIPRCDPAARARFRSQHGLRDRPVLLSVGRLTRRKGLREFVTDVLPLIVKRRPDVVLVIVGATPRNALYAEGQTPESILSAAAAAGVRQHSRLLGELTEPALHDAYQGADAYIFPVQDVPGDPEGFGMVAVEAAAHGLPTVAYAVGGVPDAVADGLSGRLVEPGQPERFAAAVLDVLDSPPAAGPLREFAQRFAWERFGPAMRAELAVDVG